MVDNLLGKWSHDIIGNTHLVQIGKHKDQVGIYFFRILQYFFSQIGSGHDFDFAVQVMAFDYFSDLLGLKRELLKCFITEFGIDTQYMHRGAV